MVLVWLSCLQAAQMMRNPAMMQQMMGQMGGAGAGMPGMPGMGAGGMGMDNDFPGNDTDSPLDASSFLSPSALEGLRESDEVGCGGRVIDTPRCDMAPGYR
jgi:hypothetical protein